MEKEKKLTFLFGIHNHQPVGNFDHVLKESFKNCYIPFINTVLNFPCIKITLHYTGPLFEWMEKNEPKLMEKIITLVNRGQAEMLGGGFYEPLLSSIPAEDALGQIITQTEYLKNRFHCSVKGIWLAERVWDPTLPSILSDAGIEYTIIDDTHFFCSGMRQKDMFGYYVTERHGKKVYIFPINKTLRYTIPFRMPHETINYIREMSGSDKKRCFIFADDGEKFGIWPGTHSWVYGEKWLEKFFKTMDENSDWIKMSTFSEYLRDNPPLGKAYLPTASYEEMMEWSLFPDAQIRYKGILKRIQGEQWLNDLVPFVRGGIWDNFLAKYPETDYMHKKMIWISRRVKKIPDSEAAKRQATTELYKGQCNCAYWHGLFGGLYLNYLRFAIGHHLVLAGNAVDSYLHKDRNWFDMEEVDIDTDGKTEIIASNPEIMVIIDPDYGGSVMGIDYRKKGFPITDVIARREEAYHKTLLEDIERGDGGTPQSIHDIHNVKEEGLENLLTYDRYLKRTFLDHLLEKDTTLDKFCRSQYDEVTDIASSGYDYRIDTDGRSVILNKQASILYNNREYILSFVKSFKFSDKSPTVTVNYEITNCGNSEFSIWFSTELNLSLLAGDSHDRYYNIPNKDFGKLPLNTVGTVENSKTFSLCDEYNSFDILISFSLPALIWFFPIETVSQSESGVEKTYQGSTILPSWKFHIDKKEKINFSVSICMLPHNSIAESMEP